MLALAVGLHLRSDAATKRKRDAARAEVAAWKDANAKATAWTLADAPDTPAATHDLSSRVTWGGARNRADRASLHLSRSTVADMLAAAAFAERIGLPFNRHWTVHYQMAGIAERDGARFVGALLTLARKQARREGGELAALWARENGDGKGGHVHILLHLPPGMTLRNRTRRWIKSAGGRPVKRVSEVRSIGGMLTNAKVPAARNSPRREVGMLSNALGDPLESYGKHPMPSDVDAHFRSNVQAVLGYLLKGADNETGRAFGLPRYGESGRIIGKRAGWTQNVGATARAAD